MEETFTYVYDRATCERVTESDGSTVLISFINLFIKII